MLLPLTYKVVKAHAEGDDRFRRVEFILDLLLNTRLGHAQYAPAGMQLTSHIKRKCKITVAK